MDWADQRRPIRRAVFDVERDAVLEDVSLENHVPELPARETFVFTGCL
jgi:hypothetical protein